MRIPCSAGGTPDDRNFRRRDRRTCQTALPRARMLGVVIAAICFLAAPARAQWPAGCIIPPGAVNTNPAGPDFFSSFVNLSAPTTYMIPLSSGSGTAAAGDLNTSYFQLFYSIANMNSAWEAANYCPVELVIVGAFPDARYFAVTDYDMHYANTQHLADVAMDPAEQTAICTNCTNPFVPQPVSGQTYNLSPQYTGNQPYVVPVGFGYIPNPGGAGYNPNCAINPFEGDNLLDATQRHLSIDWNTNVTWPGAWSAGAHDVDLPTHRTASGTQDGPNTAGSIVVRDYLSNVVCSPAPTNCGPSPINPAYVIVRDVGTGCAYSANWLETNNWVYAPTQPPVNCDTLPTPAVCSALVSTVDLSTPSTSNWLDQVQEKAHLNISAYTPQACWANGSPSVAASFPNIVAWARSPEFEGRPGADDAYVGGPISASDIASFQTGGARNGKVILFQFQLPNDALPTDGRPPLPPCAGSGPTGSTYTCGFTGSENLRYMSLTFQYQTNPPSDPTQYYIANPDGITPLNSNAPKSLVSLADSALAPVSPSGSSSQYANLVVNVGGTLPSWLQSSASGAVPVTQGVSPVGNSMGGYSVWQVAGYTVLDLTQFSNFETNVVGGSIPLQMNIRTTLPGNSFACAGQAVPFATAEYTNADGVGGGLMGPYVPLVSYVNPNNPNRLPRRAVVPALPSAGVCGGTGPGAFPVGFGPNYNQPLNYGWNYPEQYFGSGSNVQPPSLNCGTATVAAPQIDFVATQFPIAVDYPAGCPGVGPCPTACNVPSSACSQIIAQAAQAPELPNMAAFQPGLPLKIEGSGFGYLPSGVLPFAGSNPPYLYIADCYQSGSCSSSGFLWDTTNPSCQVYIANWTDSGISLVLGLQTGLQSYYQIQQNSPTGLLPLTDVSPFTFQAASGSLQCPVSVGDYLYFQVTNPQGGGSTPSNPYFNKPIYATNTPPN